VGTLEDRWRTALFGPDGFYTTQCPAAHFRTSCLVDTTVAQAVATLARRVGADAVVDVGAGSGELLTALHRVAPALRLTAVELRPRPAGLPRAIDWLRQLPQRLTGVVIAHELLDTVPCPVVQIDVDGQPRVVHLDADTGAEWLGPVLSGSERAWLRRWWDVSRPGSRAEVGLPRDRVWSDVVRRLDRGLGIAVDYGHLRRTRPSAGSLRAYRDGRQVEPRFDGSTDVTADIALDALASACGGTLHRQRDLLAQLTDDRASRPSSPLGVASAPAARLRALVAASRQAEVGATGGLGELTWLLTPVAVASPC
jgi:SAM-dependent MidA family methyltransferase